MVQQPRTRSAVNTIIPGKLLQRGQIYTWQRPVKAAAFEDWGVRAIVNFWPKVDPDLAEIDLDWYWQLSAPRSEQMLQPRMVNAAESVSDYLCRVEGACALVLCEAGKTRSVFFCILVVAIYEGITYAAAMKQVLGNIPSVSLKGFMLDWFKEQDAKKRKF